MRLIAFRLQGYRRFVDATSVKLHGDLIAFVGPNEAGKSSLLKALSHLSNSDNFENSERPRRTDHSPQLTWHFQLDDADKAAISGVREGGRVERAVVTKHADGRWWNFEPHSPWRDRSLRLEAAERLTALRDHEALVRADADDTAEFSLGDLDWAVKCLQTDIENYEQAHLDGLREIGLHLKNVDARVDVDDDDASTPDDTSDRKQLVADRDKAVDVLNASVDADAQLSPWRQCVDALLPRLPRLLVFNDEDRRLDSQYDLSEVADEPPASLRHLAGLAGLALPALRDEAAAGNTADVATRRNAANRVLRDVFDKSWNQEGIAIQFEVQGTLLLIQATTPKDEGLSALDDRSDGLRWFAALLAFTHGWTEDTILLVDEIEQHLHYDAQADLVDVLTKQSFTSKVIYTTHSFGCLPHDLGTGVRVVHPIDAATSRLENGFWSKGSGFSPLLASMGAAAASFTPTRHALIGEGPSDAILLPTILRQACKSDKLGFQVAPGLSSVAATGVAALDAEAGHVGFLIDGDEGGRALERMLKDRGVAESRIVALLDEGEELEIEDLVDEEVYCQAVNGELSCWQEPDGEVTAADLTPALRTKAVDAWCAAKGLNSPDKVAVAQRIADSAADRVILSGRRKPMVEALLPRIRNALKISTTTG